MQTIPVQYTDRIHGFQGRFLKVVSKAELKMALGRNSGIDEADWKLRCAIVRLTRRHHECTCGSRNVSAYFRRTRYIQGEPWGEMQTFYEVDMHMLTCNDCGNSFARANFQCNTGIFAIAHEGCLGGLQPGV